MPRPPQWDIKAAQELSQKCFHEVQLLKGSSGTWAQEFGLAKVMSSGLHQTIGGCTQDYNAKHYPFKTFNGRLIVAPSLHEVVVH